MPEITPSTPVETYTINGDSFKIPQPYGEGHTLTSGEASQLNQVFAENIRNNLAAKSKDLKEAGTFDLDVFQGTVDDYCANYEMGVRTGGGRVGDPVMAEAMNIARELVRQKIKSGGKFKLSDVPAKQITDLARQAIESGKNPQILELARQRVEAAKSIGGLDLNLDSPEAPMEPAPAPTGKGAKATASAEA